MAIVHFINSKSKQTAKGMGYVLRYTTQDSKTIDENGIKLVTGIKLNVDQDDFDDVEMLEDLIIVAINDASAKAEELSKDKMGPMGGLGGLM